MGIVASPLSSGQSTALLGGPCSPGVWFKGLGRSDAHLSKMFPCSLTAKTLFFSMVNNFIDRAEYLRKGTANRRSFLFMYVL